MIDTKLFYEKLNQLDTYIIIRIARNIGIDENSLSQNYVDNQRGNAINALLDTVSRRCKNNPQIFDEFVKAVNSELENYKLPQIKIESEHKSGTMNSHSEKPSEAFFKQEVAELFKLLNCKDQKRTLEDVFENHKGKAFLLIEDERIIQNWLVSCLAKPYYKIRLFPIDIRFHYDIVTNFEPAFYKAFFNEHLTCEELMHRLTDILVKERSYVFIIIYGLKYLELNGGKEKIFEFFSQLLLNFQTKVEENSVLSRLGLLLVETNSNAVTEDCLHFSNRDEGSNIITRLKFLEKIPNYHIESWIATETISKNIQEMGCNLSLISNKASSCLKSREEMPPLPKLNYICTEIFDIKEGVEELQQYWKLDRIGN